MLWCFYQTLILTAPIHCSASIPEIHFVLQIRWRNKLHFWWPENEHIYISGWTILSNTHFTSKIWHSDAEKANVGQDLNRWDGETCRYKIKLLYLYGILWRQAFTLCHIFSLTLMIVIQSAIWTCSWPVSWETRQISLLEGRVELRWIFHGGQ